MKKMYILFCLALGGCASIPEENLSVKVPPPKVNHEVYKLVTSKALEHNIPVNLAHAVIYTESRYHPKAINQGAYGLGQIKCQTARGVGFKGECSKLFEPETNLTYSFKYLRVARDLTNDNSCYAATLYQGGLGVKPRKTSYCSLILERKFKF